jgi:hypothetical protein
MPQLTDRVGWRCIDQAKFLPTSGLSRRKYPAPCAPRGARPTSERALHRQDLDGDRLGPEALQHALTGAGTRKEPGLTRALEGSA